MKIKLKSYLNSAPIDIKWKLSYNGWKVYMWEVTLHYIVNNNQFRWETNGSK